MINTELFKEVSPLSSKDCFILIERQKTNFNFPIHIHPECELNFIETAKGDRRRGIGIGDQSPLGARLERLSQCIEKHP